MFLLKTINELSALARIAFRTQIKGSDANLWPNNLYATSKGVAGMVFEAIGYIDYVKSMIFAHTARDMETLLMHGEEYGIARKPAIPASGPVVFTSTGAITVETGAVLERGDGRRYIVTLGGALVGSGTLQTTVVDGAVGKDGNAIVNTALAVISGVTGPGAGTVTAAVGPVDPIARGADVESFDDYQERILFRKRNPPHGGAPSDYVMWARQVEGVTRVFVERRWNGPGTVRVYVLMDDLFPNGIPDAANVQRVQDYLETVIPAGAILTVAAPVAHPINVTIDDLKPDTTDVRNAVVAELSDTFFRRGRVSGIDTPHGGMPFLAVPETFSRSWVAQAVANATGEDSDILAAPAADVVIPTGRIAVPGVTSFT